MNFPLKKDKAVALAFIVLSLGSAVYVAYATVNYLPFWPALSQLQTQILKVVMTGNGNPDQTTLYLQYQVSNPSGYSGFVVFHSSASVDFFEVDNPNATLFAQPLQPDSQDRTTLGANVQISLYLFIPLSSSNRTSLVNYSNLYGSKVRAHVTLTVDIVNFLNAVIGHTHLTDDNNLPLSAG